MAIKLFGGYALKKLDVDIDHREMTIILSEDMIKRAEKAMRYETDLELKKEQEEGAKEFIEEPTESWD